MRWRASNIFMDEGNKGYDGEENSDYKELEGEEEAREEEEVSMSEGDESSYESPISHEERYPSLV
jgi:hypothetical protein